MKKIQRAWIQPGCISCGTCAFLAPELFELRDKSYLKPEGDVNQYQDKLVLAAKSCPVSVIKYQEE